MKVCRKDFRNFKKDNGNKIYELLEKRFLQFAELGMDTELINNQKDNMEEVKRLIREGKEDIAFSLFFRTFPTCLPHKSRL
ncbi:MAG: hypothetical protein ACFE94_16600 [Candidatus Hodarchaeota archaeon]